MNPIPDILAEILKANRPELVRLEENASELKKKAESSARIPLDFRKSLLCAKNGRAVIAEVKKASPSVGMISEDFRPSEIASEYERGGASAISVLTEKHYFKGCPEYLSEVKKTVKIPVLRKDFIISESQIFETVCLGADTFLLIAAILGESDLKRLIACGRSFGFEPLVEVHDIEELEKTISAGAQIIGINNRNLRTFITDIELAGKLIPHIPEGKVIVGESGINSVETAHKLYSAGCNALLIGEFLMRSSFKQRQLEIIINNQP